MVDRRVAFLGGLDVSFGRWDTGAHPVVDPDALWFPQNVEYYEPSVADWANVSDIWTQRVPRDRFPKMVRSLRPAPFYGHVSASPHGQHAA